jgi:hypothetical protein
VEGHDRNRQSAAFQKFGQRGVGMRLHVLLEPSQRFSFKGRMASGIGRTRLDGPVVTKAFHNILHRAARHLEPLGNLPQGQPFHEPGVHDALTQIK